MHGSLVVAGSEDAVPDDRGPATAGACRTRRILGVGDRITVCVDGRSDECIVNWVSGAEDRPTTALLLLLSTSLAETVSTWSTSVRQRRHAGTSQTAPTVGAATTRAVDTDDLRASRQAERGHDDDEGMATISGVVGKDSSRQVRVALSGKAYNLAIKAHRTRASVRATGTLARQGKFNWLTGDVEIIAAD